MGSILRGPFSHRCNLVWIGLGKAWGKNACCNVSIGRKPTLLDTIGHLRPGFLCLLTDLTRSAHQCERAHQCQGVERQALGNHSPHRDASNMRLRYPHGMTQSSEITSKELWGVGDGGLIRFAKSRAVRTMGTMMPGKNRRDSIPIVQTTAKPVN